MTPQLHTVISISNNSLYEKNTWTDENSPCFDSIGGLSNKGKGDVYNTAVQPGSTCYSLFVQPSSTPFPTESPTEPESIGGNICTREPDYKCYKTGRPACCSDDEYTCPDYMTMCDNYPEDYVGTSYCTYTPEYGCDPATWSNKMGRPLCCYEDGGDIMNCPIEQPACNPEDTMDFVARPRYSKNAAKSNAQATKKTYKNSAQSTKKTYKNSAQSTKNTAKSDAQTTKNTAKSNADNTKNAYKNVYAPPQDEFAARGVVGRATSTAASATGDAASTAARATSNAASTANSASKKASSTAWRTATGNPPQEETDVSKVSYLRASRK